MTTFNSEVDVSKAFAYRWKRFVEIAPAVAAGEFLAYFEGVVSMTSGCQSGFGGWYNVPAGFVDTINGYHSFGVAAQVFTPTPVIGTRSSSLLNCQSGSNLEQWDALRVQRSTGTQALLVTPGILPASGGSGSIFEGFPNGTPGVSSCIARINDIPAPNPSNANWGGGGNGWYLQGPLTPTDVEDLIANTTPV